MGLGPWGPPYTLAGVLQGTRIKATKGGVCIERTSEIMWKSINGPLQDLWLTRAGGDRPVGTPQFGRLYPRLPPTKCLPARKTHRYFVIEGGELQDPLHSHPFSTLPCCPKPGSRPYHQATPLDETLTPHFRPSDRGKFLVETVIFAW